MPACNGEGGRSPSLEVSGAQTFNSVHTITFNTYSIQPGYLGTGKARGTALQYLRIRNKMNDALN